MPQLQNDIAGLQSLLDLLDESMRTADARGKMVIAAKVADAVDATERELATCLEELERRKSQG